MNTLDFENAPEGSTHFNKYWKGSNNIFYKVNSTVEFWDEEAEYWRHSYNPDTWIKENIIPIPQPAKEDWFSKGELPPVGAKCEWSLNGITFKPCIILKYEEGMVFFCRKEGSSSMRVFNHVKITFRPLKSDRDKCIEAAKDFAPWPIEKDCIVTECLGKLYDAGMLRMKEGK